MQTKLSKFSNIILKYFVIFAITFLWLNYIKVKNTVAIVISIVVAITLGYIIFLLTNHKNKRINLSKQENEKIENITLQFLYSPLKNTLKFFTDMFSKNYAVKINKTHLTLNKMQVVPLFNTISVSENDVYSVLKELDGEIVILCANYTQEALKAATKCNVKIHLLDQVDIYNILKKYDKFPEFGITKNTKQKLKFKDIKNTAFARVNAKNYLLSSIIILLTSFFVRFNIYYTVFSTLLLAFAGICLIKPTPKSNSFTL